MSELHQWRCVECKTVITSAVEPTRCVCMCRTFAKIETVTRPAVGDDVVATDAQDLLHRLGMLGLEYSGQGREQHAETIADAIAALSSLPDMQEVERWGGQGGKAHQLMAVLACAARHECDQLDRDGPHEFIELPVSVADQINDLLGKVRDSFGHQPAAQLTRGGRNE
jgi:hypothetical protein